MFPSISTVLRIATKLMFKHIEKAYSYIRTRTILSLLEYFIIIHYAVH